MRRIAKWLLTELVKFGGLRRFGTTKEMVDRIGNISIDLINE